MRNNRLVPALGIIAVAIVAVLQSVGFSQLGTPATQPAIVAKGTDTAGGLRLMVNKSGVITTKMPYKRLSVAQPEIADVNAIGPQSILVTAKKPGSTQIIVWDDADRSQVIDVMVGFDIQELQDKLVAMFPGKKIEAASINGTIALRGRVGSLQDAEQIAAVAAPYSAKVLNFLEVSGGQQVMLRVRFAEVSRAASSQLGVNFGSTDGVSSFANNVGQVAPFGRSGGSLNPSDLTTGSTAAVTLFGGGQMGNSSFDVFISALRQNNLLRVLAEPNLIAMSGQEANFLAGGEFPVPIPQSSGSGSGGGAVTVEYKQFGVRLNFVPVVLGDGRIRLKVNPEVSDLDFTNAVVSSGFRIPALTKRSVNTTIELGEGQTFALAGLLNNRLQANKDVTPLLGDLPVLGALFRSVRYERKETELLVLVTPYLVEGMNPAQVPSMPTDNWKWVTENDVFLNQNLGGPAADKPATTQPAAPQRFHGSYGFTPVSAAAAK